jgi:hypothetical protein
MSGTIDFAEFLQVLLSAVFDFVDCEPTEVAVLWKVIDYQKTNANRDDKSSEIVNAFAACGGNPDKVCLTFSCLGDKMGSVFGCEKNENIPYTSITPYL